MLDSFEDAKKYRDKFRAQKPVVYNAARLKPIQCSSNDMNLIEQPTEQEFNDTNNSENSSEQDYDADSTNNSMENSQLDDVSESQQETNSADNDVKDPLRNVVLELNEVAAFDDIFDEDSDDEIIIHSGELDATKQPNTEISTEKVVVSPGGTKKVTKVIDEDCKFTYELDKDVFQPAPMGFQVKLNDELSENIAFKENVSYHHI